MKAAFELERHVERLLDSYRYWTGRDLVDRAGGPRDWARRLDAAPFVVLSHGNEVDPILNYGNQAALRLWETDWEEFTRTPSRLTAELPHREMRARLLTEVREKGFLENYSGVRISKNGRRFEIVGAVLWNLLDESGLPAGQAATFDRWTDLD